MQSHAVSTVDRYTDKLLSKKKTVKTYFVFTLSIPSKENSSFLSVFQHFVKCTWRKFNWMLCPLFTTVFSRLFDISTILRFLHDKWETDPQKFSATVWQKVIEKFL